MTLKRIAVIALSLGGILLLLAGQLNSKPLTIAGVAALYIALLSGFMLLGETIPGRTGQCNAPHCTRQSGHSGAHNWESEP